MPCFCFPRNCYESASLDTWCVSIRGEEDETRKKHKVWDGSCISKLFCYCHEIKILYFPWWVSFLLGHCFKFTFNLKCVLPFIPIIIGMFDLCDSVRKYKDNTLYFAERVSLIRLPTMNVISTVPWSWPPVLNKEVICWLRFCSTWFSSHLVPPQKKKTQRPTLLINWLVYYLRLLTNKLLHLTLIHNFGLC